jgi:hypothetical protein
MVQQVKRGRGRPRKVQTEGNMVSNDSFDAGPVIEPVQEPVQEASVVPEASSNALPMGTDGSLLYAGREEKVLEIVHAGQRWEFKYKELSWGQKNACIDEAQQWDANEGFKFSVSKYYAAALTRMLTDTPITPVTETTLNNLDRAIGEKLIALVPQPVEQNVEEVKKA